MLSHEHEHERHLVRRLLLRAFAIAGVLFAVLVILLVLRASRARAAIQRVNESGGYVRSYSHPLPFPEHWLPGEARLVLDFYPERDSYEVDYGKTAGGWCGTGITLAEGTYPARDPGDAGLAAVGGLPATRSLFLTDTSVTDAGLVALRPLTRLELLDLDGTRIAGPGLAHLAGMRLARLALAHTPVDDEGLRHLPALAALEWIDLGETLVAGPGLAHLARLPALRTLFLSGPRLRAEGLRHLAGLPLTFVSLSGSAMTDEIVEHLDRLPDLERVHLCGAPVSDGALSRSRHKALREWPAVRSALCR
jgi:hypothetical protein